MLEVLTLTILMTLPGAPPAALDAAVPEVASPACGSAFMASSDDLGGAPEADCVAQCGSYPAVSCWTSGTCEAVDRNCSVGERGFVECNGVRTNCPVCPSQCEEGTYKIVQGSCCGYRRREMRNYVCQGGVWVLFLIDCGPSSSCTGPI